MNKNILDKLEESYTKDSIIFDDVLFSIDYRKVISKLTSNNKDKWLSYCLDRFCSTNVKLNLGDTNSWIISNNEVKISNESKQKIIDFIDIIEKKPDIDKIKFSIEKEYGFIPPGMKIFGIIEKKNINPNQIIIEPRDSIRDYLIDTYKDYEHPRGLVSQVGQNYKLWDGYYRVKSAIEYNIKNIPVFVFRK